MKTCTDALILFILCGIHPTVDFLCAEFARGQQYFGHTSVCTSGGIYVLCNYSPMPGESYPGRFRPLLLCSCDITSLSSAN